MPTSDAAQAFLADIDQLIHKHAKSFGSLLDALHPESLFLGDVDKRREASDRNFLAIFDQHSIDMQGVIGELDAPGS